MKTTINWFPELLPEWQILMDSWVDNIKKNNEYYWYVPLETSVVENMDILMAKWSDDKEIYWVKRFFDSKDWKDAKLWLHFDLTIPFARYVVNNFNDLTFPFKRYQTQKCWRWERPQLWRYREFLQSDIDVVWNEELPIFFDAEVLEIAIRSLNTIIPWKFEIFFNNRKIFDWLCNYYSISDDIKWEFIKIIDKIDKIWIEECKKELTALWCIPSELIDFFMDLNVLDLDINIIKDRFDKYSDNEQIKIALNEIEIIINNLSPKVLELVKFKVNLARWLNYYTWSIFEWRLKNYPSLSICWWWRYENLTNTIGKKKLPWVWISLWLSRIYWLLEHLNDLGVIKRTNTDVLIWWFSELQRNYANGIANILRWNNINVEIYHDLNHKPSRQIKYANDKWINRMVFIWENDELSVKNLLTREQIQTTIDNILNLFSK